MNEPRTSGSGTVTIEERWCWFCYRRNGVEVGYEGDAKCSCEAALLRDGRLWSELSDWQKKDAVRARA